MKKYLLLLLLLFTLVGCDSKNNETEPTEPSTVEPGGNTTVAEKGTLENPYNITEALAVIGTNSAFSSKKIYIKGTVEGSPYYNTTYSSYSVYLVDKAGGKSVQVYSGTLDSKIAGTKIEQGDTVVAGGYYCYYTKNNQPELAGDKSTEYPVIYEIIKGSGSATQTSNEYETLDDDGRETASVLLEFNEETKNNCTSVEGKSYFWKKDNFIFENSAGERFEAVQGYFNPYRLYVQTIVYMSVKEGTIKYLEFVTDQNYAFAGDEQVTDGKVEVVSRTLTRIYAKKGVKKIRLRNQNDIQNKKQIRVYSVKVVYYK